MPSKYPLAHNAANSEPELQTIFDPLGVHPHDIPPVGPFDEPVVQACINAQWLSHLTAGVERFIYRDAWRGTETEIDQAIENVRKILAALDTVVGEGKCNMGNCCFDSPPLTRILPDGTFQSSADGGQTWIDDPARDPRNQVTQLPPPPGDFGTQKCKGANNVVAYFELSVAQMAAQLNIDAKYAAVAAIVTGFLLILGIVTLGSTVVLASALALVVAGLSAAEFNAEFDEAKWQAFTECVYCGMDDFGNVDGVLGWATIHKCIQDIWGAGSIGGQYMTALFDAVGQTGINNAAALPSANSRSCDAAQCSFWWEFDLRDPNVSGWLITKTGTQGHYEPGVGWVADFSSSNNQRICDHWKISWFLPTSVWKLQFGHVSVNSSFATTNFQGTEGTNSNQNIYSLPDTPGGFGSSPFLWTDCFSGCLDPTDHVPELSFGCHLSGANPESQTHIMTVVRVASQTLIAYPVGHAITDENAPYPTYP